MEKEINNIEELQCELRMIDAPYIFEPYNLIESGYNFTLNEQRLIYLATTKLKSRYIKSDIKPSQMNTLRAHEYFKDLRIYIYEFKESFGIKSHNIYNIFQSTANSLFNKMIQYMRDDGTFVQKEWVTTCKYNTKEKYIELTINPDLILDLLVVKGRFGNMGYDIKKSFRTSYAFRIYELLQNYVHKGSRIFGLEDLRYKLGIYEDEKYKNFKDFNKRVLIPSIESINASTNLEIDYNIRKYGGKIGAIEFIIIPKSPILFKEDNDIESVDDSQVEEMEKRVGCKLNKETVAELTNIAIDAIKRYRIDMSFYEYIEYEIDRVKDCAKAKEIKDIVRCFKSALFQYWQ